MPKVEIKLCNDEIIQVFCNKCAESAILSYQYSPEFQAPMPFYKPFPTPSMLSMLIMRFLSNAALYVSHKDNLSLRSVYNWPDNTASVAITLLAFVVRALQRAEI